MSELLPADPELNRMPTEQDLARQPGIIIRTFASHGFAGMGYRPAAVSRSEKLAIAPHLLQKGIGHEQALVPSSA